MANPPEREIQVRDEVKHLKQKDVYGVVLAKYKVESKYQLDVRLPDDTVYYGSWMENWVTTIPVENLE